MVDPDAFKAALGSVCTPVAVVTSRHEGRPHGTTVSAFCSVSLAPPLVLVALDRGSNLLATVRAAGAYGVNVLDHGQREVAARFASRHPDRFDGVGWTLDAGLPRLDGASAWLACDVHELVDSGDHVLVIGAVHAADRAGASAPLLYRERAFGTLAA